jgi:curved DNA-binding protein CbpA
MAAMDDSSSNLSELEARAYLSLPTHGEFSSSDLKKAYRKACLQHHPDKNVGDPTAHERFLKVGEAYKVLSVELKKRETSEGRGGSDDDDSDDDDSDDDSDDGFFNFEELFRQHFGDDGAGFSVVFMVGGRPVKLDLDLKRMQEKRRKKRSKEKAARRREEEDRPCYEALGVEALAQEARRQGVSVKGDIVENLIANDARRKAGEARKREKAERAAAQAQNEAANRQKKAEMQAKKGGGGGGGGGGGSSGGGGSGKKTKNKKNKNKKQQQQQSAAGGSNGSAADAVTSRLDAMDAAVQQLQELGFGEEIATRAYYACGRNVERAAQFLFEGR